MPVIDEFARAQPLPTADHSTSTVVEAARRTRAKILRRWLAAAWRTLTERPGPTAVDWTAWRGE